MRLTSLLILILTTTILNAQSKEAEETWIGLSNLFFKSKDMNTVTSFNTNPSIILHKELIDHQFHFRFYYRKINKKKVYQQLDLFEIGWTRNKNSIAVDNGNFIEIIGGKDIKSFNFLLGYQKGKLFPIVSRLNGDIGIRGFGWYNKASETPLTSTGFPLKIKSAGLGLNLVMGLNYQVHKRINIGYSIVPASVMVFWNETVVDNPILPLRLKRARSIELESSFFKSIIGLRNFNISYAF